MCREIRIAPTFTGLVGIGLVGIEGRNATVFIEAEGQWMALNYAQIICRKALCDEWRVFVKVNQLQVWSMTYLYTTLQYPTILRTKVDWFIEGKSYDYQIKPMFVDSIYDRSDAS